MTTTDLFGPVPRQIERDRERKTPLPKGHSAPPGSGPKGETCRTCVHYTIVHTRSKAGPYRKCGLMKLHWTHGPRSDIRAKDPACRLWKSNAPQKPISD